jgi:hypothetical protein
LPRKEANYWRMDQLNIAMEELPLAFFNFTRRILELKLNATPARALSTTPLSRPAATTDQTWSGPCVIGSIYGKSHEPESNNLLDELSPKGSNNTKKAVMSILLLAPRQPTLQISLTTSLPCSRLHVNAS